MQNFKRFLRESEIDTSHFLTDKKDIDDYIDKLNQANYDAIYHLSTKTVIETVFVHIIDNKNVFLMDGYFPVQFSFMKELMIGPHVGLKSLVGCARQIQKNFTFSTKGNEITSLIGGPKKVGDVYKITDFEGKLKSFEGIVEHANTIRLYSPFKSFHNIHKYIKEIDNKIEIMNVVEECLLGFLNIKGNFSIICTVHGKERDAIDILNKHLSDDKDILDTQEELITKGFKEYAKL
jgi:hypothetical protein